MCCITGLSVSIKYKSLNSVVKRERANRSAVEELICERGHMHKSKLNMKGLVQVFASLSKLKALRSVVPFEIICSKT